MSIKEIAERALQDVLSDCTGSRYGNVTDYGNGAAVIERAIREAAQPLVDALDALHDESAAFTRGRCGATGESYGHGTDAEAAARKALAEWRAK